MKISKDKGTTRRRKRRLGALRRMEPVRLDSFRFRTFRRFSENKFFWFEALRPAFFGRVVVRSGSVRFVSASGSDRFQHYTVRFGSVRPVRFGLLFLPGCGHAGATPGWALGGDVPVCPLCPLCPLCLPCPLCPLCPTVPHCAPLCPTMPLCPLCHYAMILSYCNHAWRDEKTLGVFC